MTDKWEMLTLSTVTLTFFSAEGYRRVNMKDFLREKGKERGNVNDVISLILADGWQPFAARTEGVIVTDYSFRRKVDS